MVASCVFSLPGITQESAKLVGGKVSRSAEIVVLMPPAPTPSPVMVSMVEDLTPESEASSRFASPEDTIPLRDSLELARAGEVLAAAPQRRVELARQELYAHRPAHESQVDRARPSEQPKPLEQTTPRTLPRSEPVQRPPAPRAIVSVPSTLGTEVDEVAEPIYNPPPVYPAAAIAARLEGRVLLEISIDSVGNVKQVRVATSSGTPLLDDTAVAAVRQWRFRPALRNGQAVAWDCQLPVRFRLE